MLKHFFNFLMLCGFVFLANCAHNPYRGDVISFGVEPMVRVKLSSKRAIKQAGSPVVEIPLESYLAGVIGHEMSPRWPVEALKAQAVAARSYALYQIQTARQQGREYDVMDTQADQVFHASGMDSSYLRDLVNQTRGQVVWKKGRIVQAFYSSSCGGQSESAKDAGLSETSPLTICREDKFCAYTPFRNWSVSYTPQDLARRLSRNGYRVRQLESLKVRDRNPSGYVQNMEFLNDVGNKVIVPAKSFRNMAGNMKLKSLLFELHRDERGHYIFSGRGFGHGVGMCQYGAKVMAEQRKDFREILRHYYVKTQIKVIYP